MKRMLSALLAVLFLASVLAGCTGKPTAGDENTFVIGLDSDIIRLDPALAYDFTTNPVVNQITQGLLVFDEENQLQPLRASSWEQVDDLTYVYQIRDDVTFSDGTPMTMDDVVYSLERHRDEAVSSYLGWMYDNVDTITTGEWELTVKLSQPDANWQYVPATTAGHVVQKAFAEEAGDKFGDATTGLVGTGPYVFESWKSGSEVVLLKNEAYWNTEDAGHFEKLIFKIVPDDTTRVAALKTGDLDCILPTPAAQMDLLDNDENITHATAPGFGVTFLAFNTQKEPFNNVAVRQAIGMAIDFDAIQNGLVKQAGDASTALPSSNALFTVESERWMAYLDKAPAHTFDVEGAKALLAEAGYPEGFECNLMVNEDGLRNDIALVINQNLAAIGITANIVKVSGDEHTRYQFGDPETLDENGLRGYDMIMAGWEADFPDPAGNLQPLYQGGNSSNTADYNNAAVNTLLIEQAAESDPTVRNDLLFAAMDIAIADMPYLFLFYPVKGIAINKDYTGVSMNASWIWNIHFQGVQPVAEAE